MDKKHDNLKKNPEISIIAALDENYAIGKNNKLLCHLPADLKHFKLLTMGHPIVMGRKTFESLPSGILPGRKNIVFTGKPKESETDNYVEVNSLEKMFDACPRDGKIFITGGASLYRRFIELADILYITWIHNAFEADTFFPEIDFTVWKETSRENFEADEKNAFCYSFVTYEKIK